MEKPKLFEDRRSLLLTIASLIILLSLRLLFLYNDYRAFVSAPFYFTHATVLNAYIKHKDNHSYQVLKLQSDEGWHFYTTVHRHKDLSHTRLRLQLFPNKSISFWDYLGSFYVKSRIKKVSPLPQTYKEELTQKIASQHQDPTLQRFYNAIFFATPLKRSDREVIGKLGISHLVALSGFHLGILWGVIYGFLWLLYKPLQQRYFPYRYALIDVGGAAIVFLGIYVWFVGMPPSLVRAYAMVVAGWAVLIMGVELLSFPFLAVVTMGLTVFFPSLLVSLGFWFSVAGVFYIFLLLHYTQSWHKWTILLLVIPIGIFVLMLPVVHTVFPVTASCQLLSVVVSLLFTPFYPLSILLHLAGYGDLFDHALSALFAIQCDTRESLLPWWMGAGYLMLSLAAIQYPMGFVVLMIVALGYAGYLFA